MEALQTRVSVTEKSFTTHAQLLPQWKHFTADINTLKPKLPIQTNKLQLGVISPHHNPLM